MNKLLSILATCSVMLLTGLIAANVSFADADAAPARPTFDESGNVHVPAFVLPPSEFMSEEGKQLMMRRHELSLPIEEQDPDITRRRQQLEAYMAPQVTLVRKLYPVDVADQEFAGVPVKTFTPKGKKFDPDRVLINLHGGAFSLCWPSCAILESAPIASVGAYKVVSVNYRMAPEARHPAGVEDVATVYRELLNHHEPENIGIYGCSAGGALTSQTAAWLPAHELPQAGAIGIFGAGAVRFGAGDSAYISGYINGVFPPPPPPGQPPMNLTRGYFHGADMADPIISPALHDDVLDKFPPTMIITGTRATDLSPAVFTNSQLINSGIETRLIVAEGMSHCYIIRPQLQESKDAYRAITAFFQEKLGGR